MDAFDERPADTVLAQVAVASFSLCIVTFLLTPPSWGADLRSRVYSTLNAVLCAWVGCRTLVLRRAAITGGDAGLLTEGSAEEWLAIAFACGYFVADACIAAAHPGLFEPAMWVHHAVGIGTTGATLLLPRGGGAALVAIFLSNEASTPFVNLHHALSKAGVKDGRRTANGVVMWLTFFAVRIVGDAWVTRGLYLLHVGPTGPHLRAALPTQYHTAMVLLPVVLYINAFWFRKLTLGLLASLTRARVDKRS